MQPRVTALTSRLVSVCLLLIGTCFKISNVHSKTCRNRLEMCIKFAKEFFKGKLGQSDKFDDN